MFSNEALNISPSEGGDDGTQKSNTLTIVLNERIVNINTLDTVKKNKLVTFLSGRYQENLRKIKHFDFSHSSAHNSDFDQLIQLLSVELTTSDMSEAGKSKLIYLLHNRVIQQDKIISQHALAQQSAIVFDDLAVPAKSAKKHGSDKITASKKVSVTDKNKDVRESKKIAPVLKSDSAKPSNLFNGTPTETVLLEDVVNSDVFNGNLPQGELYSLNEFKLQPKEGLQAYSNNSIALTKSRITSIDKFDHSLLSSTIDSQAINVAKPAEIDEFPKNDRSNQERSNFIDPSMGMPHTISESEEDDDEDEIDNERLFDLKDYFKTHTQTQWPTHKEQMVIEVLHLNAGQVKNVSYLQKGQSFKITVGSKKTLVAKQTPKGQCLFYFNDQYFNGEVRQRHSGKLSVNSLPSNSKAAMNIPENSDVCLRMGSDTWVIRASTSIRSPQVNQSKTDFKTAYKSLATSTGFHLFVMLFLAITISFNALDNTPKAPEFVKMELPKEKPVIKKEIIKPKVIEKVKTKPVKKIKPKVVKKVKPKAKVKTKPKAKPKTKAAKKPVKKAQAKPKAGSGQKGNIKKRQVKNSGLLSMLGTNKNAPKRSMVKLTSLDAVASSSSSARLKVSGLKANLKGARMSLPTGELVSGSGAANALRSGGVAGIGSVAALNRGGTGKQAVGAMVSAHMSRNVKIKGGLTRDQVKSVIDAHMDDVTYCYETALMSSPSLGGKIIFEWKVQGSGSVGAVNIKSSSVKSNSIHACIKSAIKSWPFPQPSGGSSVQVSYPFIFDTVGF